MVYSCESLTLTAGCCEFTTDSDPDRSIEAICSLITELRSVVNTLLKEVCSIFCYKQCGRLPVYTLNTTGTLTRVNLRIFKSYFFLLSIYNRGEYEYICILNGSLKFEFESQLLNYKQDTKSRHFSMTLNHALSAFMIKQNALRFKSMQKKKYTLLSLCVLV